MMLYTKIFIISVISQTSFAAAGLFGLGQRSKSNKYTPLLLFRSDDVESDTTDATVKNAVEKELGMPVQRLYPLENEYHRKLLEKIVGSEEISLPFLYHRESKHSLLGGLDDGDQVRSWAKGRKPRQAEAAIMEKDIEKLLEEEFEEGLSDMEDLWGDMDEMGEEDSLETKGKQSIKKRTRSQI